MKKPMPSACMNCNKRKPNCHSYCEDYIFYSKQLQEWKNKIQKEKIKENQSHIKHSDKVVEMMQRNRYRKVIK